MKEKLLHTVESIQEVEPGILGIPGGGTTGGGLSPDVDQGKTNTGILNSGHYHLSSIQKYTHPPKKKKKIDLKG